MIYLLKKGKIKSIYQIEIMTYINKRFKRFNKKKYLLTYKLIRNKEAINIKSVISIKPNIFRTKR